MDLIKKVAKALYVSFVGTIIFTIFVLPLAIWLNSIDFLSNQYDEKYLTKRFSSSEMKVLSWLTLFFNSLIFISYILGVGLMVSLFFKGFSTDEIRNKLIFVLVISYFSPILLSFFKEMISLKLLTYFKLENIEGNTKRKE